MVLRDANVANSPLAGEDVQLASSKKPYEIRIIWNSLILMVFVFPVGAVYGLYLAFTVANWQTNVWGVFLFYAANFGVLGGAHRLWAHRSYKANLPMRVVLMVCNTLGFQVKVPLIIPSLSHS